MQKLLFDMSSCLWMSLLAGRDGEFGRELAWPDDPEKKPAYINSAGFGYENFVNHLVSVLKRFDAAPRDVVMVFEGRDSKLLRKQISPEYKMGRDHHPAAYEEFNKLCAQVRETLLGLGAIAVTQDGIEADDVLGYLTQNLNIPHTVITNDGDLLVLHGPYTSVFRDGELNVNKYGPFDFKYITLWKALVGDTTDKIKGAFGFGKTAFFRLLGTFGTEGLDAMIQLIKDRQLERLHEDVADLNVLQKIIDGKEGVYQSWELARLYPEKVNTARKPLQITAGMITDWDSKKHDARLKQWYGARRIIHAENFEAACSFGLQHLLESPEVTFDIETSTPPESDEWIEAKSKSTDGDSDKVDTFGSKLTSYSITFGKNMQYTWYFTIDHAEGDGLRNVSLDRARMFLEMVPVTKFRVIHNVAFELPVCHMAWGEAWKDNGYHGFIPNVIDTQILKSYVNENTKLGLKKTSKEILGYEQVSYAEVTQGRKMNQLTATEAFDYGCDDALCTAAIYNYCRFVMELEHTWHVYMQVERSPAYLNAQRFLTGTRVSLERMLELERADDVAYEKAWAQLRDYLIRQGWAGSVCPMFTTPADVTAAAMREAYQIVTGEELDTRMRKVEKVLALMNEKGGAGATLAGLLKHAWADAQGDTDRPFDSLNAYLKAHFRGEPEFNSDSTPQIARLLYEVLGLPVRLRNKPTDNMRKAGLKEGAPSTDAASLDFALAFDQDKGQETMDLVRALQTIKMVQTRRKLYYRPYRNFPHWKDGLIHSSVNQCATNTRRYSESDPNKQQLPKHPKYGQPSRFREVYVPHHKDAVVVSIDFTGQELRGIAEQSQDPNMLACFVGENKKDMHILTGEGALHRRPPLALWRMTSKETPTPEALAEAGLRWNGYDYQSFETIYKKHKGHEDWALLSVIRDQGKRTNFTVEYGARAPKLARRLICEVDEAQMWLEARLAAFPRAEEWKKEVIAQAHEDGSVRTMMGAVRHLPELLSASRFEVSKAERQAVNVKIQSSCAEQTKLAEGRLWDSGVFYRYDAVYIGPVHDELVASVAITDLIPWLRETHAAMVAGYAGMKVPIVASISFGRNYGEQIEVGETVDEGRIKEALGELEVAHA